MTMFYSPSAGGFYDDSFKPDDAIELDDEEYAGLVAGQRGNGFIVKDGVVVVAEPQEAPARTPGQICAENALKRDELLDVARLRIAPLKDSVELGLSTDEDVAALTAWRQYRVAVNRVDLSLDPPVWPPRPE
ncbi:tail fiber assembly protein [Pseudomonas chlororaphis]|uniref:tail fiber assembly protein n=1 Tax=Pseudomonas chlororaphis TaxID=587753 RepID=UPI0006A5FDCD|nr:tail assembly chaperone [Pseudomonas chlororaphis]AZD01405.1 Phage tail fiber protein [Pseudomonas chlororaphis subsp. chlororaphis]MBM0285089.1 tail assembly chaperone [Pseudomonas chlororaphis]MDO1505761.1 tail assembly chaperone [Pseudomonas chlororaphis]ORM49775.1 tail assembly chaperone [Pseudomonas chlororaphis subsp. chlororaphis]TWR99052.1 tail assembly chaperone [Pseudomonas chlororaphis subsp. chlororaphis]